jgi:hypothetical protein
MKKYSFEKTVCPKCARTYAIPKGSTKAFHCPGGNCQSPAATGIAADASDEVATKDSQPPSSSHKSQVPSQRSSG